MQGAGAGGQGPTAGGHEGPKHPRLTHDLTVLLRFHQGLDMTSQRALDLLGKLKEQKEAMSLAGQEILWAISIGPHPGLKSSVGPGTCIHTACPHCTAPLLRFSDVPSSRTMGGPEAGLGENGGH